MYKITKSDSAMGKEEDVNFRNRRGGGKEGNQDVGRRVEEEGVRYKVCLFSNDQ